MEKEYNRRPEVLCVELSEYRTYERICGGLTAEG